MRIAVSGSYSTGKTITTMVLSKITGFPKTHARTMREILPVTFPGKRLEECAPNELVELIIRRNFERMIAEKTNGSKFIADGGSIQEWAYCYGRVIAGFNPNENRWKCILNKILNYPRWKVFKEVMDAYGQVVKIYARNNYDLIIHLPIEFPFNPDGHRPTSERFRKECDNILRNCYNKLGIEILEVSGSINSRINEICKKINLDINSDIELIIEKCITIKEKLFDKIKLEQS